MRMTSYLGIKCRKMKPTKKHRPAIWESMLGTVKAMNSKREIRYFDYDYEAAKEFAELGEDLRVYRADRTLNYDGRLENYISKSQLVLWTKEV